MKSRPTLFFPAYRSGLPCGPVPFRARGFTLVELLVAVSILLILVTIGVPNLRDFILDNQLTSQGNAMISALQVARSEAVKRKVDVVVCPSADAASCSGDWSSSGRIVFVDSDGDDAPDMGEELVRTEDAVADGQGWSRVGGGATFIAFNEIGMSGQQHTLKLTDSRGDTRCVNVALSGRTASVTCP